MDFVTRLKQYIEYTALPVSQFADTAQIPRPTLSQILNGRNKKISNELIAKLHKGFPRLSIIWLLFGDGEMEVNVSYGSTASTRSQTRSDNSLFDADSDEAHEYEELAPYGSCDSSSQQQYESSEFVFGGTSSPYIQTKGVKSQSDSLQQRFDSRNRQNQQDNIHQTHNSNAQSATRSGGSFNLNPAMSISPDSSKRVQSIMVFYTDNSFEIFTPSSSQ